MTEKQMKSTDSMIQKTNAQSSEDIDLFSEDTEVVETSEMLYQNTVNLLTAMECMNICPDKADMYKKAARQFLKLTGYKDADEYAEKCLTLAKQASKDIKKDIYKRAQELKKSARLVQDIQSAANEFRSISGYKDADAMALECERQAARIQKKASRKRLTVITAVVLCISILLFGATRPRIKYYFANAWQAAGANDTAIKTYKKLGNYRDSKEKLTQCEYKKGLSLEAKGDYKNARKAFAAAGTYKDSEAYTVKMEKLLIKESKAGDIVKIGGCEWRILEVRDNQAFLMKNEAMDYRAYNDNSGDVTWEKATLRQWLNSSFLTETFSAAEQKSIILSDVKNADNSVYGTDGGNDTKDYVFLFSIEEANKYQSLFPTFKSNTWLRSPGNSQSSAAFLSVSGSVMDYGYIADSNGMKVRPVIWFNIE